MNTRKILLNDNKILIWHVFLLLVERIITVELDSQHIRLTLFIVQKKLFHFSIQLTDNTTKGSLSSSRYLKFLFRSFFSDDDDDDGDIVLMFFFSKVSL